MDLYHITKDVSFSGIILTLSHERNLFNGVNFLPDLFTLQVWIVIIRAGLLDSTSHIDFYSAIRLLIHNKTLYVIFGLTRLFASQNLSRAVKGNQVRMIMRFSCFWDWYSCFFKFAREVSNTSFLFWLPPFFISLRYVGLFDRGISYSGNDCYYSFARFQDFYKINRCLIDLLLLAYN